MPYKFIVAVDSKSFSDAPPEIMHALSRLTWAIQQAVGPEALLPNEMLVVGYLEKMAMGVRRVFRSFASALTHIVVSR